MRVQEFLDVGVAACLHVFSGILGAFLSPAAWSGSGKGMHKSA